MKRRLEFVMLAIVMISTTIFIITACQKDVSGNNAEGQRRLNVYLTDDPCQFDSVLIDIRSVEVKLDTARAHEDDDHFGDQDQDGDDDHEHHDSFGYWDTLSVTPGIYNVMRFRNGLQTLLGSSNIPRGAIRKIRITLGTGSTVVVNGTSNPLHLFPGTNSYVYIKLHDEDIDDDNQGNSANVWLDFDVCRSVVFYNGQYYLRPFFRPFGEQERGSIEGHVTPRDAHAIIKAMNATDTSTAIPGDEGEFKIRGLREGTYSVLIDGSNGYNDTTLNNVQVHRGSETRLPAITLHR